MSVKKRSKFLIYRSLCLNLHEYRTFRLECCVAGNSDGYDISIGEPIGWIHVFSTRIIGDDFEKINNCLCWSCGDGLFRAVYIDTFCKMGDIILYSTATGDSKDRASLDAIYAWRNAKREIIKIIDDEIDKMKR